MKKHVLEWGIVALWAVLGTAMLVGSERFFGPGGSMIWFTRAQLVWLTPIWIGSLVLALFGRTWWKTPVKVALLVAAAPVVAICFAAMAGVVLAVTVAPVIAWGWTAVFVQGCIVVALAASALIGWLSAEIPHWWRSRSDSVKA